MRGQWLVATALASCVAACSATTGKTFTSNDGGFSVVMPGTPFERTEKAETPAGALVIHILSAQHRGDAYTVLYNDYPEALVRERSLDLIYNGARDGAVANSHGALLGEQPITLDGHEGRELRVGVADGQIVVRIRMFLVGNRLYQVSTTTNPQRTASEEVTRFLDSFKLLKR